MSSNCNTAAILGCALIAVYFLQNSSPIYAYAVIGGTALFFLWLELFERFIEPHVLRSKPDDFMKNLSRASHDERREATYPLTELIPNTWYHVCDASELKTGEVKEVRMLKEVFAVWKDSKGKPVCQQAFCLHLGANLAVGGKVVDDCIECPFHCWKYSKDGSIVNIPYISNPTQCPTNKKLKTYPCVEWCGLICMYFHADDEPPAFELPDFIAQELEADGWQHFLSYNMGMFTLNLLDFVDQSGDHAHFHTLHSEMYFPWTTVKIPDWILRVFPIGIKHNLVTYRGDDKDLQTDVAKVAGKKVDKHLIVFTDYVGLTWDKKSLKSTFSQTVEIFCGPGLIVFHIPFTIGAVKAFVTMVPVEGNGTVMRVRTWIDGRVCKSLAKKAIAWLIAGISASQLYIDNIILSNKVRPKKPILQPFDGPFNRVNAWRKQFYSASSAKVGCGSYKNDW